MQIAKKNDLSRMRQHIGYHIINAHILSEPNLSGFCGSGGCDIKLLKTSIGFAKPFSTDCKFFRPFNLKSAAKSTTNSPCTNRPIECVLCKGVYSSYNKETHYKANHVNS